MPARPRAPPGVPPTIAPSSPRWQPAARHRHRPGSCGRPRHSRAHRLAPAPNRWAPSGLSSSPWPCCASMSNLDSKTPWSEGPRQPGLGDDEVHVWRASLDDPEPVGGWLPLLSADERLRAERFRFERDRRRFATGRARLRAILGRYLGAHPSTIRFVYGPRGRPRWPSRGPPAAWSSVSPTRRRSPSTP